MNSGRQKGFTLIEAMMTVSITSILMTSFLLALNSARDSLDRALVDSHILAARESVFGMFHTDLGGIVYERSCVEGSDEEFDEADFTGASGASNPDAARAARYLALVVLKRNYVDERGTLRPADVLLLQTAGANSLTRSEKLNPVCRVLYCLCSDDGDGDWSNNPVVHAPQGKGGRVGLYRCVWGSPGAFGGLTLPDAVRDSAPPEESLLAQDVRELEISVLMKGKDRFERRTLVFPNTEPDRKPTALRVRIVIYNPVEKREHTVWRVFHLGELECY